MFADKYGTDTVTAIKLETSFGHEAGGDFTLPDYMPEIKRMLYVSASPLPEGKFLNGNVLELDGTLAYNAVYAGDDGSLASAPLIAEYSADTALVSAPENADFVFVDTEIESTVCRATGPRSLNIKSRLKFKVACEEIFENDDTVLNGEGKAVSDSSSGTERYTSEIDSYVRRRVSATAGTSGVMTLPDGAAPIMCDGTMSVSSASPDAQGVKVVGNVCVKCLYSTSDGDYASAKCNMPFDCFLPIDGDASFTDGRAWGRVASVSLTPAENSVGEYTVAAEYDLDAEVFFRTRATVCTDAYSTGYETENEYKECDIPSIIVSGDKKIDVSASAELRNQSQEAVLLDLSPAVCQSSVSAADGKIAASGSVKARALLNSDGEIFSQEIEIPYKTDLADLPTGVSPQDIQYRINCTATDLTASVAGGVLSFGATVSLTYSVCRRQRVKLVTAVKLGDKIEGDASPCVKVYYPAQDETVWSICRRYRADRTRLLKNNSFEDGVAQRGKPVIIM
ncbi:MAG: DUF3794 domain-containing protein [Clostridia bacterium]|nr:DUF3794 domain-containing protein [Clostridia bacterium]